MRRARLLLSLLALAGLLAGIFPVAIASPDEGIVAGNPTGDVVVRVYYVTRDQLDRLASSYDVWRVNQKETYALVYVSSAEYAALEAEGYRLEIDEKETAKLDELLSIPGYPCYRTVEETYASLQSLNTTYPSLVQLADIGDSWDKWMPGGPAGYDLYSIRVTNENINASKPRFFLMAEIHAREYATAELAMRFVEHLLENYGTDPAITYFVDYTELYVVPMTNPDGRKFAEQGQMWRKNTDNDDGCSYSYGVDLNRNSNFKWGCCGGSSGSCSSETYRGPSRGSEPETQTIQNYVLGLFPDQNGNNGDDEVPPAAPNNATGIFITLHSAASLLLWPWGWTGTDAPNGAALQTIGVKLATYNGYTPQQSYDLYVTDGTTDDWSYGKLGVASFTYEMAGEFFQPCSEFEQTDVPDNIASLYYAWSIAKTPYMTAYGPDTNNPQTNPAVVEPGTPIQLTAQVRDVQNGNQNIAAAEYYVLPLHSQTPPGDPGTGTAMSPADGSWNSPTENVVATINTSSLPMGSYVVALRGKDANNNWGPFNAVFFTVMEPGVAPVIEGYVRDAANNAPLAATVTAGTFSANTDPATGYYSMVVISGTYDMSASAANHATGYATGVVAENYHTVRQDFHLTPLCNAFSDNVENGNIGWTVQSPWAITTEDSHSPTHSWTDSPGGNYGNSRNVAITSPAMNLTGWSNVTVGYWHKYATESGYDYCRVEYSTNGGGTWTQAAIYDGSNTTWNEVSLSVPALNNQANARLRFRLTSDGSVVGDGWHVDDIRVSGDNASCNPQQAPTAEFISNSPAPVDEPMVFTNMSVGTMPMTYLWAFGDGQTSTAEHPTHLYPAPGFYNVILTATNTLGSDAVTHQVEVSETSCMAPSNPAFSWVPNVPVPNQTVTFSGSAGGTEPLTFAWDFGDGTTGSGTAPTHAYLAAGDYTVVMTVSNSCGEVATQQVLHVCEPVSGADFSWLPITPTAGQLVNFAGSASGEGPLSFAWTFGDGQSGSGPNPSHTYASAGSFSVVMTATGACGAQAVRYDLTVLQPCDPITNTAFSWTPITPTAGQPVNFSGSADGSHPITFDWDFDDGNTASGPNPVNTFAAPGVYTVVLTASNSCSLQTVSHPVTVLPVCQPVDAADFSWSPPSPLPGVPVDLTASATGTLPISFAWDLGDGATAAGITVTHAYAAAGSYTVVLTASNTCGDQVVTHTLTVVAECLPPDGLSFSWNPPNPAAGQLVTFDSAVLTGTAPLSYTWDWGDGQSGSGASATHTFAAPGSYTVVLTVTNSCGQQTVQQVVQVSGVCQPPANADFSWAPPMPLVGETVTLNGTAEGTAPIAFAWNFGDGSTGSGATATHAYSAAGDYLVTMTATNDCGTIEVVNLVHVVAECVQPGGAAFTWAPTTPTAGQPVTFDATLISGTNPLTFTWDLGDGNAATGMQVVHSYALDGAYTVTLVVANPCGETSVEHGIVVYTPPAEQWKVFLPVVFKGIAP